MRIPTLNPSNYINCIELDNLSLIGLERYIRLYKLI